MDFKTVSNQQAQVATLFSQVLSVVANFTALDDLADSRTKCKFQQRLHWEKFINDYKDWPFFVVTYACLMNRSAFYSIKFEILLMSLEEFPARARCATCAIDKNRIFRRKKTVRQLSAPVAPGALDKNRPPPII